MNQEEEEEVQTPFLLTSLDEAATMRLEDIADPFERSSYLDQVYKLIQKNMRNKEWKPLGPESFTKWEDSLWFCFFTRQTGLSEYLPGGDISGWNLYSKLWVVLGGLGLMNHCWRPISAWKKAYNDGATGLDLPWVTRKYLVFSALPVNSMTQNDLLGQLFTLTTRFLEVDYHPELEIWVRWLQARTFDIMYIVTTRDLFNTFEFCGPRSKSSSLYGVSDSFVHETCRLFAEFRGGLYRYHSYPRIMVSCSSTKLYLRESPMRVIIPELLDVDTNNYQDNQYISEFFFEDPDVDGPIVKERWEKWVYKNLKQYYHERSRILLQKEGLVQATRPGEIARCKANNMGIAPGNYEILKKCRPTGQLDHLDYHAFRIPAKKLFAHCVDIERPSHRVRDAALLYLIDQYIYHNLQVRFASCFVKQEHQWSNDFDDLEKQEHPILLQTLGGWDVYCKGEVYQARNLGKAFLIWCYKIASDYNGYIFGVISVFSMLNELLNGMNLEDEKAPEQESTITEPQDLGPDTYWI